MKLETTTQELDFGGILQIDVLHDNLATVCEVSVWHNLKRHTVLKTVYNGIVGVSFEGEDVKWCGGQLFWNNHPLPIYEREDGTITFKTKEV